MVVALMAIYNISHGLDLCLYISIHCMLQVRYLQLCGLWDEQYFGGGGRGRGFILILTCAKPLDIWGGLANKRHGYKPLVSTRETLTAW